VPQASATVGGPAAAADVTKPSLRNADEVAAVLSDAYPAPLEAAGISGKVMLRLHVHADGTPDLATLSIETATRPEFARAAKSVVPRMRFAPARVKGHAVPAWVVMPLTFQAQ
jgi:protein TonB